MRNKLTTSKRQWDMITWYFGTNRMCCLPIWRRVQCRKVGTVACYFVIRSLEAQMLSQAKRLISEFPLSALRYQPV
jgi:hypothetical protein